MLYPSNFSSWTGTGWFSFHWPELDSSVDGFGRESGVQNCTDEKVTARDNPTMNERNAERNAAIHARRCGGLTLTVIAREFQLARETVREIVRRLERKARYAAASGRALSEAASVGGLSEQKHET
jgi:hypothetical protein